MSNVALDGPVGPLLLRQVANRVDQQAADVVEQQGLTVDQWRMLEHLVAAGTDTMTGLSATLALTGPTTTRVADRLVTLALAYRDVDETDRRRVVLQAARRGRRVYDGLATKVHAAQASVLSNLTVDEQDTLAHLLRRVTDVDAASLASR